MHFGRLHIEGKKLKFVTDEKACKLLCKDIVWAYSVADGIALHTRQKEVYQLEMSCQEAKECLKVLKKENPKILLDCPKGRRIAELNSLDNTRDLGGMRTKDGHYIMPGRLLRSGDLYHISYNDQNYLRRDYRLRMVIDFRTKQERSERPDVAIHGVEYVANSILEEKTMGITREADAIGQIAHFQGNAEEYMVRLYQELVMNRRAQSAYGDFLRILKHHGEGAVLWHCTAGKDRVGVGTALLLYILGVMKEDIFEDYMRSGDYMRKETQFVCHMLENRGAPRRVLKNVKIMLGVKETYLQSAFDKIAEKYGTVEQYIKKALGLTAFDMNFLKDRYLF